MPNIVILLSSCLQEKSYIAHAYMIEKKNLKKNRLHSEATEKKIVLFHQMENMFLMVAQIRTELSISTLRTASIRLSLKYPRR